MRYRPNVAAIVRKPGGWILIAERSDYPGSWQFPQGGVKRGESHPQALARELVEEIGLTPSKYRIVGERGPFRYRFRSGRKKEGFVGQEQIYYLVDLLDPGVTFYFSGEHPEFQAIRWIRPAQFDLDWLPPMKQPVYREVLLGFFGVKL
jgi:putative (di)nucleoside polyphosphate hydrolase